MTQLLKLSSNKKLTYLIFFIIYCTDAAVVNTNNNRMWARIAWIVILAISMVFIPKTKYTNNEKMYLSVFSIGILASMIANDGFDVNYFQRIVLLWLSLAIANLINYHRFMDCYIKIMRFIAVFSMICFVLAPILSTLPLPKMYTGEFSYINLFFTNISTHIDRNYGPLWEPGAFQLYLNWAIFYELRNLNRFRLSDTVIFVLCIFTTKSTGGIAVLAMIFAYFLLFSERKVSDRKTRKMLFGIQVLTVFFSMLGVVAFISIPELHNEVFGKLIALQENSDEINSSNVSSMTRLLSVPANIDAIKLKPIFGWGIDGLKDIIFKMYYITSNTNSMLSLPATFGIIPGVLYLLLFIKMVCVQSSSLLGRVWLMLILCAMFCTENLIASLFFWSVLFYESKYKIETKNYVY